jgi:glycosyltransferase involved in cell wall biosynthesis
MRPVLRIAQSIPKLTVMQELSTRTSSGRVPTREAAGRVSVIVPTLNEEKRLLALLERFTPALRQRFGIEVIVSDGGSTDATLDIAGRLADRVVEHVGTERQTIAAGRNAGARVSTGAVLLFFNADVGFPEPFEAFLEELIEAAGENGAATCRVTVHPSEATAADRLVLGACNLLFCAMNMTGGGMGRGECHAVTRSVFDDVGGYRDDYVAGEDFDLFNRIARMRRRRGESGIRFLWRWSLYEDPRRYRQRGYPRTMLDWFRNSMSILLLKKSFSDEWEPLR